MASSGPESNFARITERNIRTLLRRRKMEAERQGWQNRLADAITRFTGSMAFVYIHLAFFGSWIVFNLPWFHSLPKFDPPFVVLAMFASVEAIFLSTFILITQNRITEMENKRADLDLQVSLLAEHEITRTLSLIAAIAEKMGIEEAKNPELEELGQDIFPEVVLDKIEETKTRMKMGDRAHD